MFLVERITKTFVGQGASHETGYGMQITDSVLVEWHLYMDCLETGITPYHCHNKIFVSTYSACRMINCYHTPLYTLHLSYQIAEDRSCSFLKVNFTNSLKSCRVQTV